jgi:hypothetical protein
VALSPCAGVEAAVLDFLAVRATSG